MGFSHVFSSCSFLETLLRTLRGIAFIRDKMDNFSSSFEVLRAKPNLNSQDKKTASKQAQALHDAWEVTQSDLIAFSPLFEGESVESRKARVISYLRASAQLKEKHKAFCDQADATAFGTILRKFVSLQAPDKLFRGPIDTSEMMRGAVMVERTKILKDCTIPTAILSTRSVGGEADNDEMYSRLAKVL